MQDGRNEVKMREVEEKNDGEEISARTEGGREGWGTRADIMTAQIYCS